MRVRVMVGGVMDVVEAWMAIGRGASLIGLATHPLPSGLEGDDIAAIAASTPPGITPVVATAAQDVAALIALQRDTGAAALRFTQPLAPASYGALRAALPGIKLLQDITVGQDDAFAAAMLASQQADGLVLLSGAEGLEGEALRRRWQECRRITDAAACPAWLGQGLHPDTVRMAVAAVQPFGVYLQDEVLSDWQVDESKLRAFMTALDN